MRYLIYFSLFLLQLAFISCEKEEIIEDTPKETPYYLGYFEGAVNGQDISIRNKSASWRYIDAGFYSEVRRGEWEVYKPNTHKSLPTYVRTSLLYKFPYIILSVTFFLDKFNPQ